MQVFYWEIIQGGLWGSDVGKKKSKTKDIAWQVTSVGSGLSPAGTSRRHQRTQLRGGRAWVFTHTQPPALEGVTPQHIQPVPTQAPAARDHPSQRLLVLEATWEGEQDATRTVSPIPPPPCPCIVHSSRQLYPCVIIFHLPKGNLGSGTSS